MAHKDKSLDSKVFLVATSANQCLECFQQCLHSASEIHARELSRVEDQFAKFSTWAAGIGVFALGRASMDHRLRYAPEVQSVVIGLLESLSYRIKTCTKVLASYSATNSQSHIERFIRSLGDIAIEISNLNKLSNTIRKAGKEVQILKANDFQIKDDEGNDLEPFLLDLFEHHIGDRFPNVNSVILRRLARTMLLRRKRILYRRHRQGTNVITTPEVPAQTQVTLPSAPSGYLQDGNGAADETIKATKNAPSQIKSATTLDPKKFKMSSYSPSVVSASRTVALSNHEVLTFPAAPGFSAKKKYEQLKSQGLIGRLNKSDLDPDGSNENLSFDEILIREIGEITCPYCFYALPPQDVFDEKKWQNHVKNELDPYICLFEDCNQPDVLYSHSEGWISHLREHCKRWYCSSHRELGAFYTQEEYIKHAREIHKTKLRDTQLRAFAKVNTRYADQIFQFCPLCFSGMADVKGRLEDHITGHLRDLALKSLPTYPDEISDDGDSERGTSEGSNPPSRSTTKEFETSIQLPGWGTEGFWDNWKPQTMENHPTNFLGKAHVDLDLTDTQTKFSSRIIDKLGLQKFPESNEDDSKIQSMLRRKMEDIEGSANLENARPNRWFDDILNYLLPNVPGSDGTKSSEVSREIESLKDTEVDKNEAAVDTAWSKAISDTRDSETPSYTSKPSQGKEKDIADEVDLIELHKRPQYSNWSDWIWNPDYERYYRSRLDANGQYEYDWHIERAQGVAGALNRVIGDTRDSETPSNTSKPLQGKEKDIADKVDLIELHKRPQYSNWSDWIWNPDYERYYRSRLDANGQYEYDWHIERAQGVAEVLNRVIGDTRDSETPSHTSKPSQGKEKAVVDEVDLMEFEKPAGRQSAVKAQLYEYGAPLYESDNEEPELAAALARSRAQNYSNLSAGESSATSAYANYTYEEEDTPAPSSYATGTSTYITGNQDSGEQLDSRYRVEPSHRFQPGEVFKVLFSGPQDSGNEGPPSVVSDRYESRDKYGGKIFVGFRRFIVIANDQGHCTCIPIFTYGGIGCNKRGIKAEKHGIIHEKGQRAKLLPHEPKLGFPSVRVEMYQEGEKIAKESRANYAKLITVEHNVKVFFVGRVVAADWEHVSDAVNKCWEDKIHQKKKHSR